jgi:hypothetical protein
MRALAFVFNFFTPNIALVLASTFIVTAPAAINAATVALTTSRRTAPSSTGSASVSA